ncbi:FecR domain-containing protein [bacterium]|nr:FecR domain-containing protein [FCB group bacterium]MBL7190299.1 FecR domain-containing protein [bacterium]
MKRKSFLIIVLTLFILCNVLYAAGERPIAAVKGVFGEVKIKRLNSDKFSAVAPGHLLYDGDRIRTFEQSGIAVLFIDGSQIKLQENSDLTLQAQRGTERDLDTKLDLPIGDIWAKVTRRDSKFEIETPSATASVKGTEFAMTVDDMGNSNLFVLTGLVGFKNPLGETDVGSKQKSSASKSAPPSTPAKMTKKEISNTKTSSEPKWRLEIKTSGDKQPLNNTFDLQVKAINIETGKIDRTCNIEITAAALDKDLYFSRAGVNWNSEVKVRLISGEVSIKGIGKSDGEKSFIVSAGNAVPARGTVTIEKTEKQKTKESFKVKSVMQKLGLLGEIGDMDYRDGNVTEGMESLEVILDKLERGELIIVEKEIVENPDGTKKVILRLKPKPSGGK